jgi:hypothetical protein
MKFTQSQLVLVEQVEVLAGQQVEAVLLQHLTQVQQVGAVAEVRQGQQLVLQAVLVAVAALMAELVEVVTQVHILQ